MELSDHTGLQAVPGTISSLALPHSESSIVCGFVSGFLFAWVSIHCIQIQLRSIKHDTRDGILSQILDR